MGQDEMTNILLLEASNTATSTCTSHNVGEGPLLGVMLLAVLVILIVLMVVLYKMEK